MILRTIAVSLAVVCVIGAPANSAPSIKEYSIESLVQLMVPHLSDLKHYGCVFGHKNIGPFDPEAVIVGRAVDKIDQAFRTRVQPATHYSRYGLI